jgi:hypothetical protein
LDSSSDPGSIYVFEEEAAVQLAVIFPSRIVRFAIVDLEGPVPIQDSSARVAAQLALIFPPTIVRASIAGFSLQVPIPAEFQHARAQRRNRSRPVANRSTRHPQPRLQYLENWTLPLLLPHQKSPEP